MGEYIGDVYKTKEGDHIDPLGGMSQIAFDQKVAWLQAKWHLISDCEKKRFACELIFTDYTPLQKAIIADGIDYFEKYYEINKDDQSLKQEQDAIIAWACLCGSERIVAFLMKVLNRHYDTDPRLLIYASASNNVKFVEKIKDAIMCSPNPILAQSTEFAIYSLCSVPEIYRIIRKIPKQVLPEICEKPHIMPK